MRAQQGSETATCKCSGGGGGGGLKKRKNCKGYAKGIVWFRCTSKGKCAGLRKFWMSGFLDFWVS